MKKKLPPGTRGKLVLRSIPSPQVEARVTALLVRLVKRTPAERIRAIVRNPPVVLFKDLSVEKGRKLISALEKAGALAVYVPHRPAEARRLKQTTPAPRVVETPVPIVPPPGRRRRKWLRILAAGILLLCTAAALTVSLFPLVRPEGLFMPTAPPPADMSGYRPLSAVAPAVTDVGPADMPAVLAIQYRPGPDLRFIASFGIIAEQYALFSGKKTTAAFSIGAVETDGKRIRIPVLEGDAPIWDLSLTLPVRFENGLAACRELFQRLCEAGGGPSCIEDASPDAVSAVVFESTATLEPEKVIDALYRLEARRRENGPNRGLFRAAALASARLIESLSPDVMGAGDRFAAYGLAFLAAAGTGGDDQGRVRAETELANAMGYSAHAARLAKDHPEQFAEPYGRMLAACLGADLPAMKTLLGTSPSSGAVLLAARTYRRLGLLPRARQTASSLLRSNPNGLPALPDDIVPEDPGKVEQLAAGVMSRLFSDFSIPKGPGEAGGFLPPMQFAKELAAGVGRRWSEDAGLLIDRSRTVSAIESVYARLLLMQVQPSRAPEEAIKRALTVFENGKGTASVHPLTLFMRAALRQRTGEFGPAAETAAALISRPDAPLFLCKRAWQLLDDPADRRALGPDMTRHIDGSPVHRIVLAGVLEDLWQIDDAEKRLREAAELLLPDPGIYRALCRLTGSPAPLEAALVENPDAVWLLSAAGQYWAEKDTPAALEKSLGYVQAAGRLEPGNPMWDRESAALLHRMGEDEAAGAILQDLASGKTRRDPKERTDDDSKLAQLYLAINRPEKALALIRPELDAGQAEAMILAARAYEIDGQYGRALAAIQDVVNRYPSAPFVLSSAAAFNWRVGRYQQAADLIARGRSAAGPSFRWYRDDFRQAFSSAPAAKVEAAFDALKKSGAGPRELEHLAVDLRDAGRDDLALLLLEKIDYPTPRQRAAAAATAARITLRWKGPEAAAEWIVGRHGGSGKLAVAEALIRLGLYGRALGAVGNPKDYPDPLTERAWLIRTLAWVASDRQPGHLEEEILQHYRGSWLQRKTARVTGVLSRDPYHAAGRFLTGMITVDEMMAWATTSDLRCRFAYFAGFAERLNRRYRPAADWYAACLAAGKPEIVEYRWAEEELSRWALTGTAHRHRTLAEDQSFLWEKGTDG
ncbi:MAG: hypothetical protein PVG78_16620 [Desulfobacterales bacterium]|jgi:hypothetical protein